MSETLPEFLKRIEREMVEAVNSPPYGQFGNMLLKVADARRLITEAKKAQA
jgi:hypothetical protein